MLSSEYITIDSGKKDLLPFGAKFGRWEKTLSYSLLFTYT